MSGPHLAKQRCQTWPTYALATLMHPPRWGQPAVGAGLRWGQAYGTPLTLGVFEEINEGYFGDAADEWEKTRSARPAHPDSPVFLPNPPQP